MKTNFNNRDLNFIEDKIGEVTLKSGENTMSIHAINVSKNNQFQFQGIRLTLYTK